MQILEHVDQPLLRHRVAQRDVDAADAEQQREQLGTPIVPVEVGARVVQLAANVEAQGQAGLAQGAPVSVEQGGGVPAPQLGGHATDEEQGDVVGRPAVGDHLPVEDRALARGAVLLAAVAEQQVVAPEVRVGDEGERVLRREEVGDHLLRARPQRQQSLQHRLEPGSPLQEARQLRQAPLDWNKRRYKPIG